MAQRQYKHGETRSQSTLFPVSLDEYLSEANPVRAIDVYVETLNLAALGFSNTKINAHASGQPAYPPQG
ncbi:MAG: hypothetical protein HY272_11430 [Gammaproteobacteria bacterium]|nr:hypothetical protein [Gammaproteobacteria bacterium]